MMMNKLTLALIFTLIALTPLHSQGASSKQECQKKSDKPEALSQCYDLVIDKLNNELQTWINHQESSFAKFAEVTGRSAPLTIFKRSQKHFFNFREDNCRWYYLAKMPAPQASSLYKACIIDVTKQRIDELKSYAKLEQKLAVSN
jgi:uncharacterized protein YecT (DUF1311 family)